MTWLFHYPPAFSAAPASLVTRDADETVIISLDQSDSTQKQVTVAPGVRMVIDMIGLGEYHSIFIPGPQIQYLALACRLQHVPVRQPRSSRWYDKSDIDLTFFGFGPRACIGRKFTSVEAICILTMIIRDWKVEPLFNDGETSEMWRKRSLCAKLSGQTFGVPLTFTRVS